MTPDPMSEFLAAMLDAEPGLAAGGDHAAAAGSADVIALQADGPGVDELELLMASIECEASQERLEAPGPAAGEERGDVYIVIVVAGAHYAIPIRCALETDVIPAVTPVPFVPDWIRGVTNRRGEILAVVDLRRLLGLEPASGQNGRIVVATAAEGEAVAALVVDEVRGTATLPASRFSKPGGPIDDPAAPLLAGLAEYEERLLALLDINNVLSAAAPGRAGVPGNGL